MNDYRLKAQPNYVISHGEGSNAGVVIQPEYRCFDVFPSDKYCTSAIPSSMEMTETRLGAFGVKTTRGEILVCGGVPPDKSGPLDTCDVFKSSAWQMKADHSDLFQRSYAASAQAPTKEYFVTGGFTGNLDINDLSSITDSTLVISGRNQIQAGPTMPKKLGGHCMIHIEGKYFMLIGGIEAKVKITSPGSFYINYINGDYLELPYMKLGRMNHACMKHVSQFDDEIRVVVAGGRYFSSANGFASIEQVYSRTSEIFIASSRSWIQGPDLPFPLAYAVSVVTPLQTIIIGGKTDLDTVRLSLCSIMPFSSVKELMTYHVLAFKGLEDPLRDLRTL